MKIERIEKDLVVIHHTHEDIRLLLSAVVESIQELGWEIPIRMGFEEEEVRSMEKCLLEIIKEMENLRKIEENSDE
jgi:hypothetical protein